MNEVKKELNLIKKYIPQNTYRTILGQLKAGDVEGARVGVERMKKRLNAKERLHGCISN